MGSTLLSIFADDAIMIQHKSIDVSQESTPVLPPNPVRRYLLITNDSDEVIYVSFGKPAELHAGIRLERSGGSISFSLCDTSVSLQEINAVQPKPTAKRLLVTEGT